MRRRITRFIPSLRQTAYCGRIERPIQNKNEIVSAIFVLPPKMKAYVFIGVHIDTMLCTKHLQDDLILNIKTFSETFPFLGEKQYRTSSISA